MMKANESGGILYDPKELEDKKALKILLDFERDVKWYFRNYEKFKNKYRNKFVLVKKEKIICSAKNIEALREMAENKGIDLGVSCVQCIPKKDVQVIFTTMLNESMCFNVIR